MKAIKTFLFTSLMVFLPVILYAQTVSGKLIDEKEKPLAVTAGFDIRNWNHQRRRRIFHLGGYIRKPDSKNIFYRIYNSVQTSISGQYRYSSARV